MRIRLINLLQGDDRKTTEMLEKKEGRVKDLVEKLNKDEISSKEVLQELKKRKLVEDEKWECIPWAIYFILWIPLNLKFSAQLPVISFPPIVIYISVIVVVLGVILGVWATYFHYKIGGLKHDETIYLFKEGPYRVMRHPGGVGTMLLILLPIILSAHVPFSPLSVAAIIVMIVYVYYSIRIEEEGLDIPKWGDEYRQYMKEVPRFNFIKGLWNLRKKS